MKIAALLPTVLLCAAVAAGQSGAPTPDLLPQEIRVRFQTADLDQSGGLTRDEAIKGGFSSSAFAAVDKDGDNIVTVAEIVTYLADRAREWSEADTDHDDTISEQEAQNAPTIRPIFNTADQDHDGVLRQQEYDRWAQTSLMQNVDLPLVVPNIINKKF
ncbi:MAG TPA: EF-hand domain-containing protein [Candidatus Dormibacteraeota bacterium]|nr:EF-hand domain-containing protein [Candidatus Dormibacteraeota bacterium]